jgi:outer membrane protein TolC
MLNLLPLDKCWIFILYLITGANLLYSQQDTGRLLSFDQFITMVKSHHPITYQGDLLAEFASNNERGARGLFDPKLEAAYSHKSFDGKNYYRLLESGVKIPTWFGIDVKAGYEYAQGIFINEERSLPEQGLWNMGLSVPLGKGLIIDQRRAELKKALIYNELANQERNLLLNQLIYDASSAYLEWQQTEQYRQIALEGVALAEERFRGTVISYLNGDKPAIDTLESYLSLQRRDQALQKTTQDVTAAIINVEKFLWLEGSIPLEIEVNTYPETFELDEFKFLVDSLNIHLDAVMLDHPLLQTYQFKLDQLDVDLRLSREDLKPDLRLDYFPLINIPENQVLSNSLNNYKFGATLNYPLFQRKTRSKIIQTDLKIQDTKFDLLQKRRELELKLQLYYRNCEQEELQFDLASDVLANYEQMTMAENRKFSIGESSVFMVNTRESNYLESKLKRIEVLMKLLKSRLSFIHASARTSSI